MRIVSKFKDCYDGLTSNSEPTYVRETSTHSIPRLRMNEFSTSKHAVHAMLLGFCGRVYPAYFIRDDEDKQYKVYYSKDSLLREFPELGERRKRKYGGWDEPEHIDYKSDQFHHRLGYGMPVDEEKKFSHYFSVDTPAFVVYNTGSYSCPAQLVKNPLLRKYEVYKLFPIPLLFQEIETYLGSLARPDNLIPQVSDNDMIEAKGFDKFSFRKDKQK